MAKRPQDESNKDRDRAVGHEINDEESPMKKAKSLQQDYEPNMLPFATPFFVHHELFVEKLLEFMFDESEIQVKIRELLERHPNDISKGMEHRLQVIVGLDVWEIVERLVQGHFVETKKQRIEIAVRQHRQQLGEICKKQTFEETNAEIDSLFWSIHGARRRQSKRNIPSLKITKHCGKRRKPVLIHLSGRVDSANLLQELEPLLTELPFSRGTLQLGPARPSKKERKRLARDPDAKNDSFCYTIQWGKERLVVAPRDPNFPGDGEYITDVWRRFREATQLP
jgi:hypothetical protein